MSRVDRTWNEVALVQPSFGGQSSPVEDGLVRMDRLRFRAQGVCVVPYLCRQDRAATSLRRLGEVGFAFFLIKDFDDDPGSILRLLASCSIHRGVLEALDGKNHGLTREQARLVSELLEVWPPPESVEALAKEMKVAQRTLRRRLAGAGLRPPRHLLRWMRLLHAVVLRELGIESRTSLASLVGLGSPQTLARLFGDLTGRPIRDVLGSVSSRELVPDFLLDVQSVS